MEVIKIKNYRDFGRKLEKSTGCDILIQIMDDKDHVHYQCSKMGISLGVLCIQRGDVSFAPFETLKSARNDQFINVKFFPFIDDFVDLMSSLKEIFVSSEEDSSDE